MCTHACCFFLLKLGTCHCLFDIDVYQVRELAEKESEDGIFKMLSIDVTWFLTTIHIGTTVVNIGATAPVTKAATTIFGEAGVSAATGVMTVAVLLLTEITPKSIAVHNVTEAARFVYLYRKREEKIAAFDDFFWSLRYVVLLVMFPVLFKFLLVFWVNYQ
ncbi:DUF21 domain-containing protein At1g55930, chloroplastic-like isoform X2 [Camellia sinensis]|uniref:DUF21 domain-containing protein At1g55930, chloroplastic-like isoform X2 n=1 Tax=Camellia sinensis TaxID=4442 RepID=UPI001035C63C|nr:DUF21 domain-containing protein At1g55930, chloroplastic-like isoform X2 [Camellia sinensis]